MAPPICFNLIGGCNQNPPCTLICAMMGQQEEDSKKAPAQPEMPPPKSE